MSWFTYTTRVRYNECDPMGIAHHSVYPVWLEIGRTEALRAAGLRFRDMEAGGAFIAVSKLAIHYRVPIRYDDEIEVAIRVDRATRVKVDHAYEIRREGLILTTATSTVACVGSDGRPREMPEAMQQAMESGRE
ncbi:MAG: acyl-CoA thioesterase [Phycisphaerales bacterium]